MKNLFLFVVLIGCFVSCSSKVNSQSQLKLIDSYKLKIKEPSGITFFNNHLYIVSDHNNAIYKTTLKGEILKKIKTSYSDLEGISINSSTKNFFLVNESNRTIIELDSSGEFIDKTKVSGNQKNKNHGFEGICLDNNNHLFVINEKSPTELLELNLDGTLLNKFKLNFSKDVSGICYDENTNSLWLISDESESIFNVSKKGKLLKSYATKIDKGEGIVIIENKIYTVSDSLNKLFVFELPK